jgi:ketosteroid isomerase-like protein
MKKLVSIIALVGLLTLSACSSKSDFDAEAEKKAVVAASVGIDDDLAHADREAVLAAFHDDLTFFNSYPEEWFSWTHEDIGLDWFTQPFTGFWNDYKVLVSPDLAVIKGTRTDGGLDGFATAVFQKEDGQWKLIHSHLSYAGP